MEGIIEFLFAPAQLHTDTTTAGGTLEHDRVTDTQRLALRVREVVEQAGAGQQRHAVFRRQVARGVLETEVAHLLSGRADESNAGRLAGLGELGVLAEETVTRVYGTGAGLLCDFENALVQQVAFGCRTRTYTDRFIGLGGVQRMPVRL